MEWKEISKEKPLFGDYIIIYGDMGHHLCLLTTITYKGSISQAVTHWTLLKTERKDKIE